MSTTKSIGEQMKVIHTASPETHEYLMDIIQDAQALGSIVHIITIIPSALAVTENGKNLVRSYGGTRLSQDAAPECGPDYDPDKAAGKSPSPTCDPDYDLDTKKPVCNPDYEAQKSADKSPSPTCSPDYDKSADKSPQCDPDYDRDSKRPTCAPDYEAS